MLKALKLSMLGPQDSIFQHLLEPETCQRGYQKIPKKSFQKASILNKIPKIHVKSFKSEDARASGLHITTPSWG